MQSLQNNYLEHEPFIIIVYFLPPGWPRRMPSHFCGEHKWYTAENAEVAMTGKSEGARVPKFYKPHVCLKVTSI